MDSFTEFNKRKNDVMAAGGDKAVKAQHAAGKLTARERISLLLDPGSFIETDAFINSCDENLPAEGVICGFGTIDERPVCVYSQDYTVLNGGIGNIHAEKICKVYETAIKTGTPIVGIIDSAGIRIKEGLNALSGAGKILKMSAKASGVVPQICAVMGNCAGISAFPVAISDFVIMSGNNSSFSLYTNSVVEANGGKAYDLREEKRGLAALSTKSDEECIDKVKELFSYLPDNNVSGAPRYECTDDLNRISEKIAELNDIKDVISEIADNNNFFETGKEFANAMVTGFIRLNGQTIGVVANRYSIDNGLIDIDAADKAARFIRFCNAFSVPILSLTDTDGFILNPEQEDRGLARHAAALGFAFAEADVPKVNVITGKAFGAACVAMNSKAIGCDMVYAWHKASVSVAAPEIAANILFGADIAKSKNPIITRVDKTEEYIKKCSTPYDAAKCGFIDDITEPSVTRPKVIAAFEMFRTKEEQTPAKKNGNMPF